MSTKTMKDKTVAMKLDFGVKEREMMLNKLDKSVKQMIKMRNNPHLNEKRTKTKKERFVYYVRGKSWR